MSARRPLKPRAPRHGDADERAPAPKPAAAKRASRSSWRSRLPAWPGLPRVVGLAVKLALAVAVVTGSVLWKGRFGADREGLGRLAAAASPKPAAPSVGARGLDTRTLGSLSGEAARAGPGPRRTERP